MFSGDHTEVISIDYDPTRITYNQLLDLFWNNHEYGLTTRIKRQVSPCAAYISAYLSISNLFNALQYMSLILVHSNEHRTIAEKSRTEEQTKRVPEVIITEIQEAGIFYPAEE